MASHRLSLLRPRDAEALLDEEAFEHEEFLPYWAELWPSAVAVARAVVELRLAGLRVVELGCGLALPSIVAALGGADVLATDWSPDALGVAAANAERNGARVEMQLVAWSEASRLLELLPSLGPEILLADPSRPNAQRFLEAAAVNWRIETSHDAKLPRVAIHRLTRHP